MQQTDKIRSFTGRDQLGRFSSGNPGRPVGAKSKGSRLALAQIKSMEQGALQKLWEAVQNKEKWAIEYVLSKTLPATRTVELEDITIEDVIIALKEGDITPSEARDLTTTIRTMQEIDTVEGMRLRLSSRHNT